MRRRPSRVRSTGSASQWPPPPGAPTGQAPARCPGPVPAPAGPHADVPERRVMIIWFLKHVYDRGGPNHVLDVARALRQVYDPNWPSKLLGYLPTVDADPK